MGGQRQAGGPTSSMPPPNIRAPFQHVTSFWLQQVEGVTFKSEPKRTVAAMLLMLQCSGVTCGDQPEGAHTRTALGMSRAGTPPDCNTIPFV